MAIKNHPQYTENDYRYLKAKGWTDKEIIARWDEEQASGKAPCQWNTTCAQIKFHNVVSTTNK
ncbi:MAG: hypothetical protein WAS93_07920 [Burkholderiaceae bacterium]